MVPEQHESSGRKLTTQYTKMPANNITSADSNEARMSFGSMIVITATDYKNFPSLVCANSIYFSGLKFLNLDRNSAAVYIHRVIFS